MEETNWKPERKIVAAAITTVLLAGVQIAFPDIDIPVGIEGALAVIAAYLIPNKG